MSLWCFQFHRNIRTAPRWQRDVRRRQRDRHHSRERRQRPGLRIQMDGHRGERSVQAARLHGRDVVPVCAVHQGTLPEGSGQLRGQRIVNTGLRPQ